MYNVAATGDISYLKDLIHLYSKFQNIKNEERRRKRKW